MKQLILLLAFAFISRLGFAQIYFTMDSIWAPPYICQANTFNVEVFGTIAGGTGHYAGQGFLVRNDTIFVQFLFASGGTTPSPMHRSITIPAPGIGHYKIVVHGFVDSQLHQTITSAISICSSTPLATPEPDKAALLTIFPNPAQDLVMVRFPFPAKNFTLKLTDTAGKIVKTTEINNNISETWLNLKNLPAGLYLLEVSTPEGIFTQKLVRN